MQRDIGMEIVKLQRALKDKGLDKQVRVSRYFSPQADAGFILQFSTDCKATSSCEQLLQLIRDATDVDSLVALCERKDLLEV